MFYLSCLSHKYWLFPLLIDIRTNNYVQNYWNFFCCHFFIVVHELDFGVHLYIKLQFCSYIVNYFYFYDNIIYCP